MTQLHLAGTVKGATQDVMMLDFQRVVAALLLAKTQLIPDQASLTHCTPELVYLLAAVTDAGNRRVTRGTTQSGIITST